MEQYTNQQPIIIEQAPVKPQKPIGLQVTALVLGIIGFVLAFPAYFGTILSNVGLGIAAGQYDTAQGFGVASGVILIVDLVIAIFCLIALILGVVGLIKSICRATRTVKGIVMSAIGITLSEGGLVLMIVGMVIGGVFRMLIESGVFH